MGLLSSIILLQASGSVVDNMDKTNFLAPYLVEANAISSAIEGVYGLVHNTAIGIVSIIIFIGVLLKLFTSLAEDRIDKDYIIHIFGMMILLLFYPIVINLVFAVVEIFWSAAAPDAKENSSALTEFFKGITDNLGVKNTKEEDDSSYFSFSLGLLDMDLMTAIRVAALYFLATAAWLFKLCVAYVQTVLTGILYVAGPIAIVFSCIPFLKSIWLEWFKNLFIIQCWAITTGILDQFMLHVIAEIFKQPNPDGSEIFAVVGAIVINPAALLMDHKVILPATVVAVLYLMTPMLTSMFIGRALASDAMNKMVSNTAQMTKMAGGYATQMVKTGGKLGAKGAGFTVGGLQNIFSGPKGGGVGEDKPSGPPTQS